jgi:hypothetical protein
MNTMSAEKTNVILQIGMSNKELTGYPAVRSHLLVSSDLHLPLRHLKHGLGDLKVPPESLHLRLHHHGRRSI